MHLGTILGAMIFIGSLVATLYFLKKRPVVALASAFIFFGSILISNIFFPIGTIAGERLFFFPSVGIEIFLAFLLAKINQRAVLVVVLIFYSVLSFNRQGVWMTEEKLFLNALECAPNSVLSRSNAGAAYLLNGELDKAAEQLEISREIKPIYSKGLNNLGLVYWKQGKSEEAMDLYHQSLMQKYPYPGAIDNMILLYTKNGDEENALRWLRIAYPNVGDSSLRNQF